MLDDARIFWTQRSQRRAEGTEINKDFRALCLADRLGRPIPTIADNTNGTKGIFNTIRLDKKLRDLCGSLRPLRPK